MMTKWREVTSAECQRDFDDLLDVCIEIAAERITEKWGLDPVAVVNAISGGQRVLASIPDGDDSSNAVLCEKLVDRLRSGSGEIRSYAIVSDGTVEEASDTHLEVLLEHREYAIQIRVPYLMTDSTTFDLGPMAAAVGQRHLWG
ncbi:putative uncharacterized protein [Rhodococcus sp. AW25M09]|uniref:hypothetical protein n=1 Tax=Rhodococcus sp. AW25M09 TaxID=1268303 RepID=UPI0002AC9811|nr:hypothetical protein [Rhodococcus sp. AW25M09]CCQ13617.1 putative uncharacterized protein [Rhodococcus sp. AW25M09]